MTQTCEEGSNGHVFVVHGRLEDVGHDVAVVPTDNAFGFATYWKPLIGTYRPPRPNGWPSAGHAAAPDRDGVWYLSVGDHRRLPLDELIERGCDAVRAIAADARPVGAGRVRLRVVMPFLGLGYGGHAREQGTVVAALLTAVHDVVKETGVDVVLVTPDASVHAAAQHHRRSWKKARGEALELAGRIRSGQVALFLGAGVSIPAGLPSWTSLVEELKGDVRDLKGVDITTLSVLDQAQLVEGGRPDFKDQVASIVRRATRPSLAHALLAGMRCPEVVTTNYDQLYERAVAATGEEATTVLPSTSAVGAKRWVLKLHGDVSHPETIVLTRRQFVRFDAMTRPSGALLQSLLLTRHMLFVGASLNDDNVVRLALEVQEYRDHHGVPGDIGTMLDIDRDAAREALWRGQLRWVGFDGGSLEERGRALEVFLDGVAMHAAGDVPWLLDERFEPLLSTDEDRDVARQARKLHAALPAGSPEWQELRGVLERLGATAR